MPLALPFVPLGTTEVDAAMLSAVSRKQEERLCSPMSQRKGDQKGTSTPILGY